MRRLLLTPLLLGIACTSTTPSSETPEELGTRADPVLTHDQIGNFTLPSTLPYRTVSFTFDDGPDVNWVDNGVTRNTSLMIAEYLNQQGIRATFFINGVRIGGSAYPSNFLSQIVALGHRVANHTYRHDDLPDSAGTPGAQVAALHDNQVILDPHITDGMYLFRAPGDNWGQWPRDGVHACDGSSVVVNNLRGDPLLSKLAGPFCFDWDAHDWACTFDGKTPEQCAELYMYMGEDLFPGLSSRERGIIQMHDANPNASGTRWEYDFVVDLVTRLKAKSGTPYVFVPLDAIPGVRGTLSFPSPTNWTKDQLYLSDADNWQYDVGYYGTIRLGDIDGDGRADVCGRGGSGLRCALSNGDGTMAPEHLWLGIVSDTGNYLAEQYSTTFQLADIDNDGRADACMRAVEGYLCFKSLPADPGDPDSPRFSTSSWRATSFSDANGWDDDAALYGSIRVGDVDGDGDQDVCGRNAAGEIVCSLFNPNPGPGVDAFSAAVPWSLAFTSASWSPRPYGTTFELAKLNNDNKADLCVRGPQGMWCALSTGSGFATPTLWTQMAFDDASGWATTPSRYKSIRLADVDGDGLADVCGRHSTGVVCAFSTGTSFRNYRYVTNTHFGDASNWAAAEYGSTLVLGDVNGDGYADMCGRAASGLSCMLAPTRIAEFDPVLRAGRCATVGTACDSGTFYEGRGAVRPEANGPNTLQGTCGDGDVGTYLMTPSIERVRVTTTDHPATPLVNRELAVGKSVRVEVNAYVEASGRVLELFRAADATSPTWVSLGTTPLTSAGHVLVTKTYTLPSGSTQAVRAVLRPATLSGACPGGSMTDVDDLVFAVK